MPPGISEQDLFAKHSPSTAAALKENNNPDIPIAIPEPPPAAIPTPPPATTEVPPAATIPAPTEVPITSPDAEEALQLKFGAGAGVVTPEAPVTPTFDAKTIFGIEITPEEATNRVRNYEALQAKVKEYESKNPYANDYIKDLNAAVASGVSRENFDRVYNADVSKMTPLDKVVTQLQWEKGLTEADAKLIAEEKYHLGLQEEETMTDAEKQSVQRMKNLGNALLNADAKDAERFLNTNKKQSLTPPAVINNENITKAWEPLLPSIAKGMEVLQISSTENLTTDPAELLECQNIVLQTLKDYNATDVDPNSPQARELAQEMMVSTWKARNFDRAMKHLFDLRKQDKVSAARELLKYKTNNTEPGSSADTKKDSNQQLHPSLADSIRAASKQGYV